MRIRAPIVLLPLLALGCSSVELEIGTALDLKACAGFQAGITRRSDVLAALGPPAAVARHQEGVALLYEHIVMDEDQLGIGLDGLNAFFSMGAFEFLKYSTGSSDVERDALEQLGNTEGAIRWYQTTSQLNPKDTEAQRNLERLNSDKPSPVSRPTSGN